MLIITSHGGKNFIKVRNSLVILSDELNRTLNEMYIKGKYKELLFILDTCEGYSLYEKVKIPNIFFISSSDYGQKASSYSYDEKIMGPTVDKFHFLLYNELYNFHEKKLYETTIEDFFENFKFKRKFLESDVTWDNKIDRVLYVKDFFGNKELKNEGVLDVTKIFNLNNDINDFEEENNLISNFIDNNKNLEEKRKKLNNEVMTIKNYHEEKYTYEKF